MFSGPKLMADSGNIVDGTHQGGRLGVFCFSQAKVIWSNIRYTCSGENAERKSDWCTLFVIARVITVVSLG